MASGYITCISKDGIKKVISHQITIKPIEQMRDEVAEMLGFDRGTENFRHIRNFRAGYKHYFTDEKYAPPGVQTSDGFEAIEDWELWRITIPPGTDVVGYVVKAGYSVELAITERGIVALRKECPSWRMGNSYGSWIELDTDKLNEHLEHVRLVQEQALEYRLSLIEAQDPMTPHEMAEIMEVGEVSERVEEARYTDADMMEKDAEIIRLQRRIDTLENALATLLCERQMTLSGVNWKLIRGAKGR